MWVFAHKRLRQAYIVHQLTNRLVEASLTHQIMLQQRLGQRVIHGHSRIQGGIGILKNHLHAMTKLFQRFALQRAQRCSVKVDLTASQWH